VERAVTRIVTPGTLTDANLLDERNDSLLLALTIDRQRAGLAWLNLANGDLRLLETSLDALPAHFERLRPAELLLPDALRSGVPEHRAVSPAPARLAFRRACRGECAGRALRQPRPGRLRRP
jgi:DNA mismatch repair protein MutS